MKSLLVLTLFGLFALVILLSQKAADFHYRYYKGPEPIEFHYAFAFVIIYVAIVVQLLSN